MRFFAVVFALQWLFFSPSANAKKDLLPQVEIAPVGPKLMGVQPKDIKKIRGWNDPFYEIAKEFSEKYGDAFLDLVESRLSKDDYTNIVIAMGGAEHLGTLLEIGLAKRGIRSNVNIHYVDLSTETVRPWRAVRIGEPQRVRVGLGPLPRGFELEPVVPHGSVEELAESMRDFNLAGERKTLVIDTCCQGSAAESVAAVMRYWRPDDHVDVEGILVHHNSQFQYQHTIPFHSLSDFSIGEKPDTWRWSWMVDHNQVFGQVRHSGRSAFQRSDDLRTKPNQARENYKATLLGLNDGLKKTVPTSNTPCLYDLEN